MENEPELWLLRTGVSPRSEVPRIVAWNPGVLARTKVSEVEWVNTLQFQF